MWYHELILAIFGKNRCRTVFSRESMKILKRNFEHRNVIIFLIFSVIYLQAIFTLSSGFSFYGLNSLQSFFREHYLILLLVLWTIFSIVKVYRHSDKLLLVTLLLITAKNFILLSSSFNKLILALNFIYLIFAFYFFVMWELEIEKASYNPLFSKNDLEKEPRFPIKGFLRTEGADPIEVLITNIDETSCFLLFPGKELVKLSSGQHYELVAWFENVEFLQKARVVSQYDQGYGLELLTGPSGANWSDLYKVCLERGLFV